MMKLYIFLCLVSFSHLAKLPSDFLICKFDPKELPKCLPPAVERALNILQKPLPELGIPSIDPMEIESLTYEGGTKSIVLNQYLHNVKVYNIKNAKVQKAEFFQKGDEFDLVIVAFLRTLMLEADYEVEGRILLLPINGKGKGSVKCIDLTVVITLTATKVTKKNNVFLNLKNATVELLPARIEMNLGDLITRNKQMSNEINRTLNENWREIFAEFKVAYEKTVASYLENVANQLFSKVPMDDLFPPS